MKEKEKKMGLLLFPRAVWDSPNSKRRCKLGQVKLEKRFVGRDPIWFRAMRRNGARDGKWV